MHIFYRYYTGDQQALFEEAHLIDPRKRLINPNNPTSSVSNSLLTSSVNINMIIRLNQLLLVVLQLYQDKNMFVIYVLFCLTNKIWTD